MGHVAVVTGAGSGLGRELALALGKRRFFVVLADIQEDDAKGVLEEVKQSGGEGEVVGLDVTDPEALVELASRVEAEHGGCDLLINNAGVAVSGKIGEIPVENWRWCVDVNLFGPVYGCHAFVPGMKKRGRGHVVNIASVAGYANAAKMGPYNTSKAAVISLSETLRAELEGTGVGVTVVCPGFFPTNIIRNMRPGSERERGSAQKLLDRSQLSAGEVASRILIAVDKSDPYLVLPRQAQVIFWLRRLFPAYTTTLLQKLTQQKTKDIQ